MYVTSHLVKAPDEQEGFNAFVHLHGAGFPWPTETARIARIADDEPGKTARERVRIPPGGNRVRAYLDILARDRTPLASIAAALSALALDLDQRINPTVFAHGHVVLRYGVEPDLQAMRHEQLSLLARIATELLAEALAHR